MINLPVEQLTIRRSFGRRVALEFYRGEKWAEYLAFEPAGLQRFKVKLETMTRDFPEAFMFENAPDFFRSAVLSLIKSLQRSYLPGDGVHDVLLGVYTMTTNSAKTADISSMKLDEMTAHYNSLAAAIGKPPVKMFKSKDEAQKRIAALHGAVKQATPAQKANKEKAAVVSASRAAGLATLAETAAKAKKAGHDIKAAVAKGAAAAVKKPTADKVKLPAAFKKLPVAKKAAAVVKQDSEKKPRGQGIGTFCKELITAGKTNEEVLAAVRQKFPGASTSAASVAWYRNALRSE